MQRALSLAGLLAAAALSLSSAAQAGEVLKCVDGAGRATFTDQPCPSGSSSQRLAADGAQGGAGLTAATGSSGPEDDVAPVAPVPQRHVLPAADLRHDAWKRPVGARPAALAGDIATLKAARRIQLLQDAPRASLAGIN